MGQVSFFRHALSYWLPELKEVQTLRAQIAGLQNLRSDSLENPSTALTAVFNDVGRTTTGISVTENNSMAISTVYACVKVIAETMALMELEIQKRVGKAKQLDVTHPNYLLLKEPSQYYNRFEWIESSMMHVLLWGNAYTWIKRNRYAEPKQLLLLCPWQVKVKLTERGRLYYEYTDENNVKSVIQSDDMIHIKNLGTNGMVGMSPIAIQRENLANSMAKQQHEGAFYTNGAKSSGILMMPGNLGLKEQKNVAESFEEKNSGAKNRFKTIILEDGVKYQQLTIPQNDAQFLESKKFDSTEICGWFRVPPHMVANLDRSTFSNIGDQDRSFAKYTMNPWTTRVQQELDRKLFFEEERLLYNTQFNLDDIVKGDITIRYTAYNTGIQAGFLKPSEVREAEGWTNANNPELDQFFMNGTMRPVTEIIKPEPAAPVAQPKVA